MSFFYYLDGHTPVPTDDIMVAQKSMSTKVGDDVVYGIHVSTVFLGINHAWGDEDPVLFETMLFPHDMEGDEQYMWRYSTWEEAEEGHEHAKKVAELIRKPQRFNGVEDL